MMSAAGFMRLFFACVTLLASQVHAGSGAVVFGSWLSVEYAREAEANIENQLGLEAVIVRATVNGRDYQRVMSESMAEADARKLVATAKSLGLDAWFLTL